MDRTVLTLVNRWAFYGVCIELVNSVFCKRVATMVCWGALTVQRSVLWKAERPVEGLVELSVTSEACPTEGPADGPAELS